MYGGNLSDYYAKKWKVGGIMRKINRVLSLILCAAMLIGILPVQVLAVNNDDGTCTITTPGTIYKLVSGPTAGKEYLILSSNAAGQANALSINGSSVTNQTVTVKAADSISTVPYVETIGSATVWTAGNGWKFENGSNCLTVTGSQNWGYVTYSLGIGTSGSSFTYNTSNKTLSSEVSTSSWWGGTTSATVYVRYNNGWGANTSSSQVYFYEETTLSGSGTYSLTAENQQIAIGDSIHVAEIVRKLLCNNVAIEDTLGGQYSYEIISGNGTILSLENENLVADAKGTATVRVKYTWGENIVWKDITVEVTGDPYYTVDIKDSGKNADVVTVKNVTKDTTKQLTADVLKYGRLPVENASVSWTSSDPSVVTVDANGMLHFAGKDGVATVFAVYKDGDKEYVDTVTISASTSSYIIPSDGTNDFPEYPNEGSIRFDKTAVAVGNFNDTGVAQVELSMTGVPFTTNNTLDVVLLIDKSSSMTEARMAATREATKVFVKNLVYNEDGSFTGNRIYVGCYVGGNPNYTGQEHRFRMENVTKEESDRYQIVNSKAEYDALLESIEQTVVRQESAYGTEYAQSLQYGYDLLNSSKDDGNKQFCVFMTDGIPNVYQGETSLLQSSDAMAAMFTGNNYQTRDTDYQYEKHTTAMKNNGVTVFTVGLGLHNTNSALSGATATQCLNVASMLLNDMSGPAGETAKDRDTGSNISKQDEYFFSVEDQNAAASMANVFDTIAKKIQEAAKDVMVEDVMGDQYTMIFEPPNEKVKGNLPEGQEFYIEILDYTLNPVTQNGEVVDYVRDTATAASKLKLYMGQKDKKDADGNVVLNDKGEAIQCYYAASNATGTPYAAPVFEAKPLGSMYYWTTEDITGNSTYSGVSVEVGGKTYYFDTIGKKQEEGEAAPAGWYSMTSGAYASGTVTEDEHKTPDNQDDDTSYCNDLIIATPYFVYNASNKTLNWTLDKIGLTETVMRYFLYLDDSGGYHGDIDQEAGTYPTNKDADLTYTNFQDNEVQQKFPKPQMTWHGAQMSYVFYLVNQAGQPVNRAGRVVPFSEAVYVTDVYTKSVTWSGDDTQDVFRADNLASKIVPDVYTLFDETAYYNIHVFANENAMQANNHFEIGGEAAVNTTYVFNTKADAEKYNEVGVYAKKGVNQAQCRYCEGGYQTVDDHTRTGFDYYDTVVAFAVLWIPSLSPDEIVVDYGLDVVLDVAQNDLATATPVGLTATAPLDNNGNEIEINRGQFSNPQISNSLDLSIGQRRIATAKMEGKKIRITLDRDNAMHFTDALTFFYVSEVTFYDDHHVLQTVYMYSYVRVIPATTIYFEEDYVDFDADWTLKGSRDPGATQAVDRPGPNRVGEGYDADNVYGFDDAYAGCTLYSQNAAMYTQVTALSTGGGTAGGGTTEGGTTEGDTTEEGTDNPTNEDQTVTEPSIPKEPGPTATFSFTGTGFDIIGRTDQYTTSILVTVTGMDDTIFVDTYFQGAEGIDAIKQVPVVTVHGLAYGTYEVSVEVVINNDEGGDFSHGETGEFYLDAVQIYDPTGKLDGYQLSNPVDRAYILDNETYPRREEFGNAILQDFGEDKLFEIAMFIDGQGSVTEITDYDTWGPNNELYLAPGQTVKLVVDQTYRLNLVKEAKFSGLADMQLGIKLANGTSASVTVGNGTSSRTITLNSATDLNFSIEEFYDGILTITNNGGGLVSLTNLKVTALHPTPAASMLSGRRPNETEEQKPEETEPQTRPAEPTAPVPEAPDTLIARGILAIKQAIAAVIIAVANGMEEWSNSLQRIADSLFAGGG